MALSACNAGDEAPQSAMATMPNVVSVVATEYALQAPDTVPAGWTVLRMHNHGGELHYGHIVRLDSGKTVKGEFKSFVVRSANTPQTSQAAAPKANMVVRLMDFSFALDTPVTPGHRTIRVGNAGVEPHDLVLMKLAPGRTVEDVHAWLNPERARRESTAGQPPPSLESLGTGAGGIAAIGPGIESFF